MHWYDAWCELVAAKNQNLKQQIAKNWRSEKIKLEATKTCNFSAVMQYYTVLCIEIMHDVVLVQSYLVLCIRIMHGVVLVQCYVLPCIDKILMVLMMHDMVLLQSYVLLLYMSASNEFIAMKKILPWKFITMKRENSSNFQF